MKNMDLEKRLLNMTRYLLRHAALAKEEKDEIEDMIAYLMEENSRLKAEKSRYYGMLQKERKVYRQQKEALQEENKILSESIKSLAKEMKKMKQGDFWLDELVEYKLNTEEIHKIMESLKKKEEKKYEQSIGDGTAVVGVIEH